MSVIIPSTTIALAAEQYDSWGEPDLVFGQPNLHPAPVLSDQSMQYIFGNWALWIQTAAAAKGAPQDYVLGALLSTASALIGNARWVSPKKDWKEPPILWVALIGDPSSNKSPALDAVTSPLAVLEAENAAEYQRAKKEWDRTHKIAMLHEMQWEKDVKSAIAAGGAPPDKPDEAECEAPPVHRRISITDATIESVASLTAVNPRGLLLVRDELFGWAANISRYNSGSDAPFWLEAYGGRSYIVDRKNAPTPIHVSHLSVAILGGIQPDRLKQHFIKSADDGTLARFIVLYPDRVALKPTIAEIDESIAVAAFKRLRGLEPSYEGDTCHPVCLPLTPDAEATHFAFRQKIREWEDEATGIYKSHIGKMPGHVIRIALVLAHLDWAHSGSSAPPTYITQDHIERATTLVGDHFRLHAYRAYGGHEVPLDMQGARKIAQRIKRDALATVTIREIQRANFGGLSTAKEISQALDLLIEANWLKQVIEPTAGRSKTTYVVNPRVHEMD